MNLKSFEDTHFISCGSGAKKNTTR